VRRPPDRWTRAATGAQSFPTRRFSASRRLKSSAQSPIFKALTPLESHPAMLATAPSRNASDAYRRVGVETSVQSASAHKLTMLLYDGLNDALAQARGALLAGRIEAKGRAIGRAVRIVEEGLRAGLNLEDGGELAANLHRLYGYVALRLTQANVSNDAGALEECVRLLEPLRSAWRAIDPARTGLPQ
jgi:flagellar protein FliS